MSGFCCRCSTVLKLFNSAPTCAVIKKLLAWFTQRIENYPVIGVYCEKFPLCLKRIPLHNTRATTTTTRSNCSKHHFPIGYIFFGGFFPLLSKKKQKSFLKTISGKTSLSRWVQSSGRMFLRHCVVPVNWNLR